MIGRCLLSFTIVIAAAAGPRAGAQPAPQLVSCEGAFAKDSSHERLVTIFGKQNVVFQTVPGPEGTTVKASVVFPKDPKRRLEFGWWDEKGRKRPSNIATREPSTWATAAGIKIGMSIAEVEKLNGKPFKLSGFDWDYGGRTTGWQGGRLAAGCNLSLAFAQADDAPESAALKVSGDQDFLSDDKNMRAVKPRVVEIAIGYAK